MATYRWKKYMPARHGKTCTVLARGRGRGPRNVLVQFEDGTKYVVPRWAVRES